MHPSKYKYSMHGPSKMIIVEEFNSFVFCEEVSSIQGFITVYYNSLLSLISN